VPCGLWAMAGLEAKCLVARLLVGAATLIMNAQGLTRQGLAELGQGSAGHPGGDHPKTSMPEA